MVLYQCDTRGASCTTKIDYSTGLVYIPSQAFRKEGVYYY